MAQQGSRFESFNITPSGQASVHVGHIYQQGPPDLAKELPWVAGAAFSHGDKPKCLENTRVELLHDVIQWGSNPNSEPIFWLSGIAGTGKSTIACTVAHILYEREQLGASFFFSRGGGDLGSATKFFTTIAFQLSKVSPELKRYIHEVVSEHPDITQHNLRHQWEQLIFRPLSKLKAPSIQRPLTLVVDALDECDSDNDTRRILQLFTEAKTLESIQLRVFVTSRPEIPIWTEFRTMPGNLHRDVILHDIPQTIVDKDLSAFLAHEFKAIRMGSDEPLSADWPGKDKIDLLVSKAHSLFIYAATVSRFVKTHSEYYRTDDLLRCFIPDITATDSLSWNPDRAAVTSESPTADLDKIYTQVLEYSLRKVPNERDKKQLAADFRKIVGTLVILFEPLPTAAIAILLNEEEWKIRKRLHHLHAVLEVPDSQGHPVRLLHPSFRDFVLDQQRCPDQQFRVDGREMHGILAESCLELMTREGKLRKDICGLRALGAPATSVDSSLVEQYLPAELQYACRYWVQHLQRSGIQLKDNDKVHDFLQKHLLHWLEVLSLIGKTSEGILAMTSLDYMAVDGESYLQAFIHDANRFYRYNRTAIEEAPLQTYGSALIFAPETSIVRQHFREQIPNWIHRLSEGQKDWSHSLQTLEGHSGWVTAVAFSQDGRLLASASHDSTVRLWDPATGASQGTLKGHSGWVLAVAFSQDGKLASASHDSTIQLWDPATGASQGTLKGHSGSVTAVTFSQDGKLLASASDDSTVRLWDPATGASQGTLKGHSGSVMTVIFSWDSKLLVSASDDSTIQLWNPATGALQGILESYSGWIRAIAFSQDNRLLASASDDGIVQLWDPVTGVLQSMLEGHSSSVTAVTFSQDNRFLASASDDSTIQLWDPRTRVLQGTLEGHSGSIMAIAFSQNSKLLASASHDSTVRLWNPATRVLQGMLEGHSGWVRAITFSQDSKLLASASHDGTIRLWDLAMGTSQNMLKDHSGWVRAVAFSQDGRLLASASDDSTVQLWNPATGASQGTLKGHSSWVRAVAFSQDGRLLASASDDGTVRLWDPATGDWQGTLEGHSGSVTAIVFSPDGKLIASASRDKTVQLWDMATGARRQTLQTGALVYQLSFSRNSQFLETNRGRFDISSLTWSDKSHQSRPLREDSLLVKGNWVVRGTEKILWLPSDYRPSCMAVRENVLAMGHHSGGVSIFEFSMTENIS